VAYADVTEKMDQLKAARAKRGRVYNSVDEFMAERAMIIDLVMERGRAIQVSECICFSRFFTANYSWQAKWICPKASTVLLGTRRSIWHRVN